MPVEVYPVVASVAAACGVAGYALKRKWFNDPQITVSKSRRSGGTTIAYDDIDDAKPFWADAKNNSIHIFGSSTNPILDNKKLLAGVATVGGTYTVHIPGDDGEEEDGEEVEDAVSDPMAGLFGHTRLHLYFALALGDSFLTWCCPFCGVGVDVIESEGDAADADGSD